MRYLLILCYFMLISCKALQVEVKAIKLKKEDFYTTHPFTIECKDFNPSEYIDSFFIQDRNETKKFIDIIYNLQIDTTKTFDTTYLVIRTYKKTGIIDTTYKTNSIDTRAKLYLFKSDSSVDVVCMNNAQIMLNNQFMIVNDSLLSLVENYK